MENENKILKVMRGVPGSGKSTLALAMIAAETPQMVRDSLDGNIEGRYLSGNDGVIVSTDLYFISDEGEYLFDGKMIGRHHATNYLMFVQLVKDETNLIVLDNTNTQIWHFEDYVTYARAKGYEVHFVEMPQISAEEAFERNTHGVPLEAIRAMIAGFEPLPSSNVPEPMSLATAMSVAALVG